MRIAISITTFRAALIAAFLSPCASLANPAYTPGAEPKLHGRPLAAAVAVLQTPVGTAIDYGNLGTTFSTGYTLIDQATVACKAANCTIAVDMSEQVGNAGVTGNWFGVCPLVDGNFAPTGCPYAGEVPSDYGYVIARVRQTFAVKRGFHTVQAWLYLLTSTADSDAYDMQYTVFTP